MTTPSIACDLYDKIQAIRQLLPSYLYDLRTHTVAALHSSLQVTMTSWTEFASSTAQVNGQTIAYRKAGSGPALLLIHGHPQTNQCVYRPIGGGCKTSERIAHLSFIGVLIDQHMALHRARTGQETHGCLRRHQGLRPLQQAQRQRGPCRVFKARNGQGHGRAHVCIPDHTASTALDADDAVEWSF